MRPHPEWWPRFRPMSTTRRTAPMWRPSPTPCARSTKPLPRLNRAADRLPGPGHGAPYGFPGPYRGAVPARAEFHVEALNEALRNIPATQLRMHVCWGNYEGPHDHDIDVDKVLPIILKAKPAAILFEAANPRHAHEWRSWKQARIPDDKVLVPGLLTSTSNYVEHPELIAQRIGCSRTSWGVSGCWRELTVVLALLPASARWTRRSPMPSWRRSPKGPAVPPKLCGLDAAAAPRLDFLCSSRPAEGKGPSTRGNAPSLTSLERC